MPTLTTNPPAATREKRALFAAIAAAVAASICCVGPLVLIALGASGAWMSSLTFLEPVRPLLILGTGGFLGVAFARVYAKKAEPETCEPGSLCANAKTDRFNKIGLWGITVLVAGLMMVPTFVGMADEAASPTAPANGNDTAAAAVAASANERPAETSIKKAVLAIENMTCAACPHNVKSALSKLDGVKVLEVTLDPPRAVVEYDSTKVSLDDLVTATTDVGYPSSPANS